MKKFGVIALVVFSLLFLSLAVGVVSAQGFIGPPVAPSSALVPIIESAKSFYDNIFEPFGKFLLGKNTDSGELFFAKLLFFLVLITLVNYALSQIEPLKSKAWFISAIVSILAIRWITPNWIETIVLPYTALGITLTAFLPFVLFFFFVQTSLKDNDMMRKVAWVFAAVVFVGLFLYRDTSSFSASASGFNPALIYLITAGLSLVMVWFDKNLQSLILFQGFMKIKDAHKRERAATLMAEVNSLMTQYSAALTDAERDRLSGLIKEKEKTYKNLFKV